MKTRYSWAYNFDDYKTFCLLTNQKPCRYTSLMDYKKFLRYIEEV